MRGASGPGDDDLETGLARALGEFDQAVRRAMRRDDAGVEVYVQRRQGFAGVAHGRPIGLAAHDDGDGRRDFGHGIEARRLRKATCLEHVPQKGKQFCENPRETWAQSMIGNSLRAELSWRRLSGAA